jgi:predicted outer membrane repeat protein
MSNTKHLSDILKVCSVLPALVVVPAVADLPNTSGNAWVFGDLNLDYDVANNSAIGGRVSVINGNRGNDFPEYNVVGRSVNIAGTDGKKPSLYVGPVNLTLRELGESEEFVYNWQVEATDGESNWTNTELKDGEVSYKDVDIAKQAGIVWNDSLETIIGKTGFDVSKDENYLKMAYGLSLFAHRDDTVVAGNFSADNVNLTLDGTNVVANNVVINASKLNIANANVPKNIKNGLYNASDGYTSIKANNFVVQNALRIDVENGATLDLSQSENVLFSTNNGSKFTLYNNGTVKFGGDVQFENVVLNNRYSTTDEQKKIFYNGDGDITFVNAKISSPGIEYSKDALVGGLVDFRTTGNISFSGDKVDTGSGIFVNSTVLSDMILQANKISVSGGMADMYGGAIFNAGDMSFLAKENWFTENRQTAVASESKYYKYGGGALYNRGAESTAELTIGFADGSSKNTFTSNIALQNGGAIESRTDDPDSSAVVNVIGTTLFSENQAGVNGGAIMNWTDADTTSSTAVNFAGNVTFNDNVAGNFGGAIYNGGTGANVNLSNAVAVFENNIAKHSGGAIYNDGVMTINESYFKKNTGTSFGGAIANTGMMTINNGSFDENKTNWWGGAIYNDGGTLTINGGQFKNNKSISGDNYAMGGAIFNYAGKLDILGTTENPVMFEENIAYVGGAFSDMQNVGSETVIKNAVFSENHASADAGAAGLYGKVLVENTVFSENTAAITVDDIVADVKQSDGGGAILVGGTSDVTLKNVVFEDNETGARGGAISARHGEGYVLNIDAALFEDNKSANFGGGIANVYAGTVNINNADFDENKAEKSGGAIYNGIDVNYGGGSGVDSTNHGIINLTGVNTFKNNKAGLYGGAIYNDAGGTINFAGTNTFANNFAGKYKNDIYNMGTLNVTSGTLNIDGGITGETGVLNIAKDATMNMGTATVIQDAINIDGTVNASALSSYDFAKLYGDITGGGVINLTVASSGTYKMFDETSNNNIAINIMDKAYNVVNNGKDGVVVSVKPIEDLVKDINISSQTAGVVSALANSADKNIQKISLAAQHLLNSGDTKLLEEESAKLNPEDKTVAQSVSMSVAGRVMSLASNRMSGAVASVGRSGGDSQQNGLWAQGVYSKSKLSNVFEGSGRGFAFGADTIIDNKYTLGVGFAYNNTDVTSGTRKTDVDSKTVFMYGQYQPSKWFVNATLAYTMSEYTENSDPFGAFVESLYDADSYGVQLMSGYDYATGMTPEFGLRYLHVAQDKYTNGVNEVAAIDSDFLTGVAGLRYTFMIDSNANIKFRPEMHAAATYDFISDASQINVTIPSVGSSYVIEGQGLSKFGAEFGIGLTAFYNGVELSAMYDLDLHEDYTSHTGMIKFRGQF